MAPKENEVFDKDKVAVIAERIQRAIARVALARKTKETADSELRGAECDLGNIRSEFTRAVDGQLDMDNLKQQKPVRHEVLI